MKKFLLLAAVCAATLSASATDFYVIGDNVNGQSWAVAAPDAKMTDLGGGIYEWEGSLGTGFKINDGTWDNTDLGDGVIANFGSNGEGIVLDEPYYFETGGSTGNINFAEGTIVENAKVVLNMNDLTITLSGNASGEVAWFIAGNFNEWTLDDNSKLTEEGDKLVKKGLVIEVAGAFKVTNTGWGTSYGLPEDSEVAEISAETLSAAMQEGGGDFPYSITGTYDVEFTFGEEGAATIVFTASDDSGVEGVGVDADAEVVYYNLQGVKVEKPVSGVYVKVVNNKASKVLAK